MLTSVLKILFKVQIMNIEFCKSSWILVILRVCSSVGDDLRERERIDLG